MEGVLVPVKVWGMLMIPRNNMLVLEAVQNLLYLFVRRDLLLYEKGMP
jgi:hypothetical protein